jgi:hypothetical protein
MAPPSTEGVTLSGPRIGARLEADSILEKSVPATDAEGAKGHSLISQAKGQNHHHRSPTLIGTGVVGALIVCESLLGFRDFFICK